MIISQTSRDAYKLQVGMSENGVYPQWNSHLVGIMISKTIGCRGTRHFQTNYQVSLFFFLHSPGLCNRAMENPRCKLLYALWGVASVMLDCQNNQNVLRIFYVQKKSHVPWNYPYSRFYSWGICPSFWGAKPFNISQVFVGWIPWMNPVAQEAMSCLLR